jgi:hypothetical protein
MFEAIREFNNNPSSHRDPLSRAFFSLKRLRRIRGRPYYSLMERIHQHVKPRSYLEIGVCCGDAMVLAHDAALCIGIDPEPVIRMALPPQAQLHRITSDEFFADKKLTSQLEKNPIDLAFVDGMHLFEYALRDFLNIERFSNPNATILAHDCLPIDRVTAARERTTTTWTGDVWKLVVCLKKYRPDLQIRTIDVAPSGLTIIRGLDPKSTTLSSRMQQIEEEFIPMDFDEVESDLRDKLNVAPNDWGQIKEFLSSAPCCATTD